MVQGAAMYMQERIEALRRDIDKHGKAKVKKGQQPPPAAKVCPPSPFVACVRAYVCECVSVSVHVFVCWSAPCRATCAQ